MTIEYMTALITVVLSWVLGYVAKRTKFISDNLIPIQNIIVGVLVAVIEYVITKDFSAAIALSGLLAGGSYDVLHNLQKLHIEGINTENE